MRCCQADVESMLLDLKAALSKNLMQLIPRKKNMDFLSEKGLLWADIKTAIYGLTYSDYFLGPEDDRRDPSSDKFWVFKVIIENDHIYIKFKILYQVDGSVKVVSFHIDTP